MTSLTPAGILAADASRLAQIASEDRDAYLVGTAAVEWERLIQRPADWPALPLLEVPAEISCDEQQAAMLWLAAAVARHRAGDATAFAAPPAGCTMYMIEAGRKARV